MLWTLPYYCHAVFDTNLPNNSAIHKAACSLVTGRSLQRYSQSRRLLSYRPFLKNRQQERPPEVVPAGGSHWQPMDTFVFHKNCTSWNHGTAGNREAGGFVNSAVKKRLEVVPASSSHWQPMDTFVFHRNCTSWNHGTAGNREAGSFVNRAVIG